MNCIIDFTPRVREWERKDIFTCLKLYTTIYSITSGHFLNIFGMLLTMFTCALCNVIEILVYETIFLNNRFRQTFLLLPDFSVPHNNINNCCWAFACLNFNRNFFPRYSSLWFWLNTHIWYAHDLRKNDHVDFCF